MVRRFIGEGKTNSNGVATVDYTGTGKGKILIVATSGDLEASMPLYDVLFKDIGTSSDHTSARWSSSTITADWTTDPTCTILTPNDSTVYSSRFLNIQPYVSKPITIEYDACMTFSDNVKYNIGCSFRRDASSTGSSSWTTGQYGAVSGEWYHFILKYDPNTNTSSLQINDNNPINRTLTVVPNRFYFTINQNTENASIKYKDFVIY